MATIRQAVVDVQSTRILSSSCPVESTIKPGSRQLVETQQQLSSLGTCRRRHRDSSGPTTYYPLSDFDNRSLDDNVFHTPRVVRKKVKVARNNTISSGTPVFRHQRGRPVPGLVAADQSSSPPSPPTISAADIKNIRLKRAIGTGGFGTVYLGVFHDRKVAVKKLHRCVKNVKAKVESFRAECSVRHLKHENIVRVLAISHGDPLQSEAVIVMEYAGRRSLQTVINDARHSLSFRRRVRYSLEIANAVTYIHANRVVHLDLKPANVIISSKDHCKLGDFGCCQTLEDDTGRVSPTNRSYLTGTFAYRAPELLRGEPPTTKADIFSFGIILWQLSSRETPYSGEDQHVVIFSVVANNTRPKVPVKFGRDDPVECSYRDLYIQCWNASTDVRPTAKDLADVLLIWMQNS